MMREERTEEGPHHEGFLTIFAYGMRRDGSSGPASTSRRSRFAEACSRDTCDSSNA